MGAGGAGNPKRGLSLADGDHPAAIEGGVSNRRATAFAWEEQPASGRLSVRCAGLLLLPRCDSDGARARSDGKPRCADIVPMHRMRRVRPLALC